MAIKRLGLFALGVLASSPAFATGLYYHHPEADSPFYTPTSMVVGDLDISGGITTGGGDTAHEINGVGRASVPLGSHKFEIELGGEYVSDGTFTYTSYGAFGHLYADSPSHAIGAYAGALGLYGIEVYTLGVEGNAYLGATTLRGQFGIIKMANSGSGTIYVARGGANYYFTPNKKIMADVIYYNASGGGGSGGNVWVTSAGVECRFPGTPWSIYGLAGYSDYAGTSAWTAKIGARVLFDDRNATLQQHDKAVPFNASIASQFFQ